MAGLQGKVALVTGGSRGIGRAVAERLARDGAAVVIGYRSREEDADAAVQACRAAGSNAWAVRADLADPEGPRTLFEQASTHFDELHVLVNNAGIATATPFDVASVAAYDEVFAVNSRAVFLTIAAAFRCMTDGGRIVNVSSINTVLGVPGIAAYAGSKAAVEAFTRVAAREFGPRGITVNAVLPGGTDTEMLRAANAPEALERIAQRSPFGRLGTPAEVADVVAWLASEDARWVTGQCIRVDGGLL